MYDFSELRKYYIFQMKSWNRDNYIVLHVSFGNSVIILGFCTDQGVKSNLHSFKSHRQGRKIIKDRHSPLKQTVP